MNYTIYDNVVFDYQFFILATSCYVAKSSIVIQFCSIRSWDSYWFLKNMHLSYIAISYCSSVGELYTALGDGVTDSVKSWYSCTGNFFENSKLAIRMNPGYICSYCGSTWAYSSTAVWPLYGSLRGLTENRSKLHYLKSLVLYF